MREMTIYCDETGTHDCEWFAWGSVWCPRARAQEMQDALDRIARRRTREVKWSDLPGPALREALADWFFETPWVCFQALVVRKSALRIFGRRQKTSTAFKKLLCTLLVTQMARFNRLPGGPRRFEVVVDQVGDTCKQMTKKEFRILTAAAAKWHDLDADQFREYRRVDSREHRGVQLADLMVGALRSAFEREAAGPKDAFCRYIARQLGWHDLRGFTRPNLKFNVWMHRDCMGVSDGVEERAIRLLRPGGDPERRFPPCS